MNLAQGLLSHLYELTAHSAVFLPLPTGSKECHISEWQNISFKETQTSGYQARLLANIGLGGNIGVLLGPPSGSLCAIDIDFDNQIDPFLTCNPQLQESLRTRGAKGCQIFGFVRGNYPQRVVKGGLKIEGKAVAEWRGGNAYSVIFGIHPETQKPYERVVDKQAVVIEFSDIVFPPHWLFRFDGDVNSDNGELADHGGTDVGRLSRSRFDPPFYSEVDDKLTKRISNYIANLHAACSGKNGHSTTLASLHKLRYGFALVEKDLRNFAEEYNDRRCKPKWNARELAHKVDEAINKPFDREWGYLIKRDRDRIEESRQTNRVPKSPKEATSQNNRQDEPAHEEPKIFVTALSPSEIKAYQQPPGLVLVGDNHIVRGSVTVIGGPPGVGKSRASVALAKAGATRYEWLGLPVHCKFKTLIVQNENGRHRLKLDFSDLDCELLDQYVRVTPPPPFGLCFNRRQFRDQLATIRDEWNPACVCLDPWNQIARDERAKDYLETFDTIRLVFPPGDESPAVVIIAHTRKPGAGERTNGKALLNLLAGSYSLGSVPRTVFIMQNASDEVTDDRVVWTCCKNNDGDAGQRSAWIRQNGLFTPVYDFDWNQWDSVGKSTLLSSEIVVQIVAEHSHGISKQNLVEKLKEKGVSKTTAYRWIEEEEKRHRIKFSKAKDGYVPV
jgi:hypothetical protein